MQSPENSTKLYYEEQATSIRQMLGPQVDIGVSFDAVTHASNQKVTIWKRMFRFVNPLIASVITTLMVLLFAVLVASILFTGKLAPNMSLGIQMGMLSSGIAQVSYKFLYSDFENDHQMNS